MCKLSCSQSCEQDEQIAILVAEIACLKASKVRRGIGRVLALRVYLDLYQANFLRLFQNQKLYMYLLSLFEEESTPCQSIHRRKPSHEAGRLVANFKESVTVEWMVTGGGANLDTCKVVLSRNGVC